MINNILDIYINNNKLMHQSIINIIDIIILNLGILLILVEGSIRGIIGLILIGISINIYLILNGYLLISLLLIISLVSISIIISLIKYNTINIYKSNNNKFIKLFLIFYILIITNYNYNNISNIEIMGYLLIFESNLLISLLILILFLFILLLVKFNNNINISYNIVFNLMSYIILNVYILFAVALLICYIPIIIRYKSSIYKWSSDIYEVGIGVNMSNSIFNSLSNNNIGNYQIYFYIYIFVFLDIIINIIILLFLININNYINLLVIFFIILSLSYALLSNS